MQPIFNRFIVLIIFLFALQSSFAQKYSNEFLSIGVNARAQGMSNAVVAHSKDVNASFGILQD